MSQGITRAELDAWGDRLTGSLKETLDLHLKALPCSQHDSDIRRISGKAEAASGYAGEAYIKASQADVKAEVAKDVATGNIWRLVKWGIASLMAGAGFKLSAWANWILEAVQHHK